MRQSERQSDGSGIHALTLSDRSQEWEVYGDRTWDWGVGSGGRQKSTSVILHMS